jgi:hypothetical protein
MAGYLIFSKKIEDHGYIPESGLWSFKNQSFDPVISPVINPVIHKLIT